MLLTIGRALADSQLDPVDARTLLRHVLGTDDASLITRAGEPLPDAQSALFAALVRRRKAGEPVAYIIGTREFFSLEFKVTPAVLIPRPETELLVEFALECIAPERMSRVLDLGTGSGCIAISIARERPRAQIVAVDASAEALVVAHDNAQRLLGPLPKTPSPLMEEDSAWLPSPSGRDATARAPRISAMNLPLRRFPHPQSLSRGEKGASCFPLPPGEGPRVREGLWKGTEGEGRLVGGDGENVARGMWDSARLETTSPLTGEGRDGGDVGAMPYFSTPTLTLPRQRGWDINLRFVQSDWFSALAGQQFDLIVANPPYVAAGDPHLAQGDVRFEPSAALVAGNDGLDCIRFMVASAPQYLVRGGWLAFEHGYDQSPRCRELLARAGFTRVFSRPDLAGIERLSGGQWGARP